MINQLSSPSSPEASSFFSSLLFFLPIFFMILRSFVRGGKIIRHIIYYFCDFKNLLVIIYGILVFLKLLWSSLNVLKSKIFLRSTSFWE